MVVEGIRRAQREDGNNQNIGYNVLTDKYEDMVASGIIDPAKVTRSALQNAASIAGDDPDDRGADHRHSGEGETRRSRHARVLNRDPHPSLDVPASVHAGGHVFYVLVCCCGSLFARVIPFFVLGKD